MPLEAVRETSAVLQGLKLQVSPLYCQPLVPVQQPSPVVLKSSD